MRRALALVALLALVCARAPSSPRPLVYEDWLGVYLADQKVGYSFTRATATRAGYRFETRLQLRLSMMGETQNLKQVFDFETAPDFGLTSFSYDLVSGQHAVRARGTRTGTGLEIELVSAGQKTVRTIPAAGRVLTSATVLPWVAARRLPPGSAAKVAVFDPTLLSIVDASVTPLGPDTIPVEGTPVAARKFQTAMLGMTTTSWTDTLGRILREEAPPGLVSRRQSPEEALRAESGAAGLDILSLFSVDAGSTIADPSATRLLRLELSGADLSGLELLDDDQQAVGENPLILEIRRSTPLAAPVPLPVRGEEQFRRPEPYIQSDAPEIIAQAKAIIGQTSDAWPATAKLVKWVYRTLEKRATASVPSAVDVLASREGDCNEHAILFTALARAAGIPCRICVGLVYMDGRFYYHAWNRVFVGRWVSVDPTFGEETADATHLKLMVGGLEEQARVLKVVGQLRLRVLGYR